MKMLSKSPRIWVFLNTLPYPTSHDGLLGTSVLSLPGIPYPHPQLELHMDFGSELINPTPEIGTSYVELCVVDWCVETIAVSTEDTISFCIWF